ncbi:MAG TPA: type II toxin-antitoxin system RelE/ParE family toxin [Candidatus Limnocylindria bacterium]|nr:type II toxin-antitoxin system RelE/ParE family toxin [Candidatus Limnocylindria bacterium]
MIRAAHPDLRRKIRALVDALAARPEIGKPLVEELAGFSSARLGRYRVIYRWSRADLEVVLVGPRATIYEDTSRLLRRNRDPR